LEKKPTVLKMQEAGGEKTSNLRRRGLHTAFARRSTTRKDEPISLLEEVIKRRWKISAKGPNQRLLKRALCRKEAGCDPGEVGVSICGPKGGEGRTGRQLRESVWQRGTKKKEKHK